MTAPVLDLRRQLPEVYSARADPRLVDVPDLSFLMVDGHGDPNTASEYADAVRALYSVAYAVKFRMKAADGANFAVMPLEGLWWAADMAAFSLDDKSAWNWTMMIAQPDPVTPELVDAAKEKAATKAPRDTVARVRLERFAEGLAAQVLHIGPYAAEAPTIARLHAFIADQGRRLAGKHHEIYLGDPRRAAPDKLRTIIRQPVR